MITVTDPLLLYSRHPDRNGEGEGAVGEDVGEVGQGGGEREK